MCAGICHDYFDPSTFGFRTQIRGADLFSPNMQTALPVNCSKKRENHMDFALQTKMFLGNFQQCLKMKILLNLT